ncbi:ATP-dependent zinc metalloprotease FtsH [Ramlibacter sp.]|uniref:ATP-dependent zinc metalloprotease FtsH n=1 Tax=Ramlibacter sp. TaxID=1917967 RepID=UPI002BDF8596|nr:ATP-dependent zinc metalloprotease FtsH [Ramlibacter sp.]HWI82456.1 ATP-dependent zinc metalloprotease FtsH [Ramlibacter sp.]
MDGKNPPPGQPPVPRPDWRFTLWYLVFALIAIAWTRDLWVAGRRTEPVAYSEFVQQVKDGRVESVIVGSKVIEGKLKTPMPDGRTHIVANRVEPALAGELMQPGVKVSGAIESTFLSEMLSWLLPAVLLFALWGWLAQRVAKGGAGGLGGLLSIGKSRARVHRENEVKVTFAEVAGVDEAKEELRESVEFLKDPKSYGRLGARMPKGVLLVGPPGTGKTLLARAVAGEAGVPFFSITGSEFVEMFVGVGAARVRDLFEQARAAAPCIIFIDELDALGRARGVGPLSGGHDEKEQTLNQLLAEMDGFDASTGVVILAATNRPEILDPALMRAGRFDRQVLVDRPDRRGRVDILKVHLPKVTLGPDVDVEAVAALTPGFAGADLANLVNEAALLATRRGAAAVTMQDFTAAVERIVAGLEKRNRVMSDVERRTVAVHEMGHALVAIALPGTDPVHKISIIPRGIGALGYTLQRPTEDHYLVRRAGLENRIAVLFGGRAAEALVFGELSTGAADDLAKASELALDMVTRFGMADEVGQVTYERPRSPFLDAQGQLHAERPHSEATARAIDRAVRRLVDQGFERATAILRARRDLLDEGAALLLAKETLTETELAPLVARARAAA